MKYTFHSTDPDNCNEGYCPIIYPGVCRRVRWWVSELTSIHNIVVLDSTDYIVFDAPGDSHIGDTDEGLLNGNLTWNPTKQYISTTSLMTDFNSSGKTDITLEKTDTGCYQFKGTSSFSITSMSYNVKQALGFYYVSDGTTLNATAGTTTTTSPYYYIEAKAMSYSNFTPVWFLISNLGQPNQITANNDKWNLISCYSNEYTEYFLCSNIYDLV